MEVINSILHGWSDWEYKNRKSRFRLMNKEPFYNLKTFYNDPLNNRFWINWETLNKRNNERN